MRPSTLFLIVLMVAAILDRAMFNGRYLAVAGQITSQIASHVR